MKIGPRYKIAKRLGAPIFEKTQSQKFALSEARSAKNKRRRRRRPSGFGEQLVEKQKARFTYGVSEKQFARYVREAIQKTGNPAQNLYNRLEARLDNVVYRMGLAKSRRMARQMVSHGHFTVNNKKIDVPSYEVKTTDIIAVRDGSKDVRIFDELKEKGVQSSPWVTFDEKKYEGKVKEFPKYEATSELFNLGMVLEFYSR